MSGQVHLSPFTLSSLPMGCMSSIQHLQGFSLALQAPQSSIQHQTLPTLHFWPLNKHLHVCSLRHPRDSRTSFGYHQARGKLPHNYCPDSYFCSSKAHQNVDSGCPRKAHMNSCLGAPITSAQPPSISWDLSGQGVQGRSHHGHRSTQVSLISSQLSPTSLLWIWIFFRGKKIL